MHGRAAALAAALLGLGLSLGGCVHDEPLVATTAGIPGDYRMRHPIAVEDANHSIVVFVGQGRGGLSAEQRADVMGLAQSWQHEGTGAISVDVPVNTPNARAATDSFREIQAMFAAAGVPPRGLVVRRYHPEDPRHFAAIRLSYPRLQATAGPCGLWPDDLGPSIKNPNISRTRTTTISAAPISATWRRWSRTPRISCSRARKRRPIRSAALTAFEKYRKGNATATTYPEAEKAKLSDTGK